MKLKKSWILIAAVALLLAFAVSGTVAWLAASTDPVVNEFTPGKIDTEIDEDFDGTTKSKIVIENKASPNSTVAVYVRVAISGYWCDKDGNIIAPWDAAISLDTTANTTDNDGIANGAWFKCASDGYYYYNSPLQPGEKTTNLLAKEVTYQKGADGSYLVMNVLHQSIQATPTSTVAAEWGVTVSGTTISKN